MASAPRDDNRIAGLVGASSSDPTTAVVAYVDPTTHRVLTDASVTISSVSISGGNVSVSGSTNLSLGTSTSTIGVVNISSTSNAVTGTKTNNFAVPSTDNLGVLSVLANASAPTYLEGMLCTLSTDLAGNLRTTGSFSIAAGTLLSVSGSTNLSLATGQTISVTGSTNLVLGTGSATIGNVGITGNVVVSGSTNLTLASLPTGTNNIGIVSISATSNSVNVATFGGTNAQTGSGTATGALRVELANNGTGLVGLNTGTNSIGKISDITTSVVPGTGATNLGKAEDAGHSSGDTGVSILGVRNDALAAYTSADADYTTCAVDSAGRFIINLYAPTTTYVSGTTTITSSTADFLVVSAPAAGLRNYITAIQIGNTGSTSTLVTFKDGASGSTLGFTIAPAGGGSNIVYPIPLRTTQATAFAVAGASATTSLYVSAQGFKAP